MTKTAIFTRGSERVSVSEPLYRMLGSEPNEDEDSIIATFLEGAASVELEIVQGERTVCYISDQNPIWGLIPGEAVDASYPFGPTLTVIAGTMD